MFLRILDRLEEIIIASLMGAATVLTFVAKNLGHVINEVWGQFKEAVAEGRNLKPEEVEAYADGRVMTGAKAVKLGFADQVGTVDDAFEVAKTLAKLKDYEIFELPKHHVFDAA